MNKLAKEIEEFLQKNFFYLDFRKEKSNNESVIYYQDMYIISLYCFKTAWKHRTLYELNIVETFPQTQAIYGSALTENNILSTLEKELNSYSYIRAKKRDHLINQLVD